MKKQSLKILSLLLTIVMVLSVVSISAFAAVLENDFGLKAESVTVDGTADKTVDAVFYATKGLSIITVDVHFSTTETEYLSLSGNYTSPVELTGLNYYTNGHAFYSDTTLNGYPIEANGNVFTANFTVNKDTPTGEYPVSLTVTEIQDSDFDTLHTGTYTAMVKVTNSAPVAATSVTLNKNTLDLTVGSSKTLTATVRPEGATNKDVTWVSSDPDVATVANGVVTAVKPGKTTITVSVESNPALNDTCEVTVTDQIFPVTGVALSNAEVSVGRTIQLEPVFTPANTTQRDLKWSSSNNMIATIDANGRVRGVAEGKVTITATSTVNSTISAACVVTVTPAKDDPVVPGIGAIIGALGNGSLPFNDVTARDYFYDAVKWAVDQGITSGTSRYTFSPDAPCTRAQVVTFLWRAAGCPQPSSKTNPFTDVHADDYFYTAVLWAVENGITNGTSAKTFSPDATVTRAQVVTFLWRANGQPTAGNSGFLDVSSNAYYARAVDWAFANGITTGVDYGAFGPDTACTRAQIVTFLYRAR